MRPLAVVLAVLALSGLASSQEKAPALTEVQRLSLQNLSQRIELAQLRAQAAQREFDLARDELVKLVGSLKVEGYTLDLQSLAYTKDAPPPPPPKPAPKE